MRRLIVLPLLAALVLAACGSTSTTAAPSASGSPSGSTVPSGDASAVPVTPAPPAPTPTPLKPDASKGPIPTDAPVATEAPVTPAPSQTAACAKLNDAIDTIDLYLQVFTAVDRTSWKDMTGPDSPVQFDPKDFTAAIKTLAKVKGTAKAVTALNEIDRVMKLALAQKDPFGEGIRTGPRLVQLANDDFILIETALVDARAARKCPQV
jgi:hypothetical protein